MISDSDWKYVQKDYAEGKEGTVSVVNINGHLAILKQFKKTKSENKMRREVEMQTLAFEMGMAPEIYAVDYRAKRIFMKGIEHKLVDTAKARNPPALTRNEEIQIVDMYQKMDKANLFHNDGNALNILHHPSGRIVIIDYGMSKKITPALRKKAPEGPNIKYTWNMLKRSLKHRGIKAWDNMEKK